MTFLRLLPGQHFADRFRVDRLIGQGAMAHVYAVHATDGGPGGALKVLHAHIMDDDPKAFARFNREVVVGKVIRSEHVVEVLSSGVHGDQPWLLMELLEGHPLDAYIALNPAELDRWTVLDQMWGAMAVAHRSGVIHRDLKSENILVLDRQGAPFIKLLDFGISKTLSSSQGLDTSLTSSGFGTPLWAAPEQAFDDVRLTPSCDVWALGLLTFFVLTSKLYWLHMNDDEPSAIDISLEILRSPIEDATARARTLGVDTTLPTAFDDWFRHCVNRNPAERFETAAAAHAALTALTATN